MEPPSQSDKEPRTTEIEATDYGSLKNGDAPLPSFTPEILRAINEAANAEQLPLEFNPETVQDGVRESALYLEESTGKKISLDDLDEESKRILFDIDAKRSEWTEAMDNDFTASLQLIHPDVRGSGTNSPL